MSSRENEQGRQNQEFSRPTGSQQVEAETNGDENKTPSPSTNPPSLQQAPSAETLDGFLLEKMLAIRHGSSIVRQSGILVEDQSSQTPERGNNHHEGSQDATTTNRKVAAIINADGKEAEPIPSDICNEQFPRPQPHGQAIDKDVDVDEVVAQKGNSSWLEKVINSRLEPTDDTPMSTNQAEVETEIISSSQHVMESAGNGNDGADAVHDAETIIANTNTAPYQRQKTPDEPGAFHRVGGEIVPRYKAQLTSSAHTRIESATQGPNSNTTTSVRREQDRPRRARRRTDVVSDRTTTFRQNEMSTLRLVDREMSEEPLSTAIRRHSSKSTSHDSFINLDDTSRNSKEVEDLLKTSTSASTNSRESPLDNCSSEGSRHEAGHSAGGRDVEEGRLIQSTRSYQSEGDVDLSNLVEARAVIDESEKDVFGATPVDLKQKEKRENDNMSFRRKVAMGVCLFLSLIVIVPVATSVSLEESAPLVTAEEPSVVPTLAPTLSPTHTVIVQLPELTKMKILADASGPQARAYQWCLEDPSLQEYTQDRLIQRFALATIFFGTDGENWDFNESWLNYTMHECEWFFRSDGDKLRPCSTLGSGSEAYRNLLLYGNNLRGGLPEEVFLLTSLERLDLQNNKLAGTLPTPSWWLDFPSLTPRNLEVLALTGNQLSGSLPTAMGMLTSLEGLYIGANELTGTLPTEFALLTRLVDFAAESQHIRGTIPTQLSLLTSLGLLSLPGNFLTGPIPSHLGMLTSLKTLDLAHNKLNIPQLPTELGRLTELNHFRLASPSTYLEGTLPSELGLLWKLQELSFDANDYESNGRISGSIPSELGLLSNAAQLNFAFQRLVGPIPSELGLMSKLEKLIIPGNGVAGTAIYGLDGSIPSELGKLPLTELVLSGNSISGSLPMALGSLSLLEVLSVHTNRLSQAIPTEMGGGMRELREILLHQNFLTGQLPGQILKVMTNIKTFSIYSNYFGGDFPTEIGLLTKLEVLRADSNFFTGLPSEIGMARKLKTLVVIGNKLEGTLASELGQLAELLHLYLGSNSLSGTIPSELGRLSRLEALDIPSNAFTGYLPTELSIMSSLQHVYLYQNLITGAIPSFAAATNVTKLYLLSNLFDSSLPASIGQLTALHELSVASNFIDGSLPSELGSLTALSILSLSDNQISGRIPRELGFAEALLEVQAENNQLSDTIPTELGLLKKIQRIRFGGNKLSGALPTELGDMMSTLVFSFSSNQLGGSIPLYDLSRMESLQQLWLGNNSLIGTIPTEIGLLSSLSVVSLHTNRLSKTIPTEMGLLTKLLALELFSNALITGSIPSEITLLTNLVDGFSSMAATSLEGTIPEELCSKIIFDEAASGFCGGRLCGCTCGCQSFEALLFSQNNASSANNASEGFFGRRHKNL